MIRSMTGYGAAESELADGRVLRAEVRTVNHRHLSTSVRLPRGWEGMERGVVERVRAALSRGSVSLAVRCESVGRDDDGVPALNMERARGYVDLIREAAIELKLHGYLQVDVLARLPGVLRMEGPPAAEPDVEALHACVDAALREVVAMREVEGGRLEVELRACLGRIVEEVESVEAAAPARLLRERDRLRERVAALSEGVEVDEDRLAREIAYLAERWDIAEEIVRLRSHVALFEEGLGGSGKAGKRLGFVVQEMNREANTVGSKANDASISASAIAIKEELERVREQLENVE